MRLLRHFSHLFFLSIFLAFFRLTDNFVAKTNSHKYLSLPLIPVEEFLEIHPEYKDSDPHELMIARINHEHAEREKLEQARQELLKRKQALIAENKKRKDDLANLDQDLERFIDVRISCENRSRKKQQYTNGTCVILGREADPEDFRKGILISFDYICCYY